MSWGFLARFRPKPPPHCRDPGLRLQAQRHSSCICIGETGHSIAGLCDSPPTACYAVSTYRQLLPCLLGLADTSSIRRHRVSVVERLKVPLRETKVALRSSWVALTTYTASSALSTLMQDPKIIRRKRLKITHGL
jgi:hypothetical protein